MAERLQTELTEVEPVSVAIHVKAHQSLIEQSELAEILLIYSY